MMGDWQRAGWPVVRIRDIGRLHGGGTPSRKRPEYFQGEIPWITGQDIPDNRVATIEQARDYVTEEAVAESATRVVPAGAVLITTRVSVGKTAVAGRPICFSQDVTALLIHSEAIALPAYVAHYLRSRQPALLQKNQGSTIAGITRDSLALEQIPLPPLSEQQRIVDILQEAEEIRRLRAQAQAKTAELIPAMFREFFGEIGANSKRWPVVAVSNFVESFRGGKSLMGSDTELDERLPRVLKISAVTSGLLIPSESKALPANYEAPEEHRVREGDLLITRANTEELVGATALVWKDCPGNLLLPDKIWRFVWKNAFDGTPEFVWALFQQTATRKALGNIASGTGGSMKNISMAKLMKMRVIWPPKKLQEQFSKALREILELSNDTTGTKISRSLTASLSANAFTGQLTARWRIKHSMLLREEARARDDALAMAAGRRPSSFLGGLKHDLKAILDKASSGAFTSDREPPECLSKAQQAVLHAIEEHFTPSDPDQVRWFTAEVLTKHMGESVQTLRAHLAILIARGFVIAASQEQTSRKDGSPEFGSLYRLPVRQDGCDDADFVRAQQMSAVLQRLAPVALA